jgi:hypothetical protein
MLRLQGALGLFVLVLGGAAGLAPPAGAAVVPPPSLATEQLLAGPDSPGGSGLFMSTFTCNADQSGQISFTTTGMAVGPYPGTFTEKGTVQVGAGTPAGPVTSLTTDFQIASGTTLIVGTKTLAVSPTDEGACADFGFLGFDTLFTSQVSYTATIELADSSMFQDSGSGSVHGESAVVGGFLAVGPPTTGVSEFEESFDTSNGVVPLGGSGHVTGGGWILGPTGTNRVSFGFEAKANPNGLHATCTVIDHATLAQIKCQSIDSLVVAGTHATFTGDATVNGTSTSYRIDVVDLGEPGSLDTFAIHLGNGYAASGRLMGGNIQIHSQ